MSLGSLKPKIKFLDQKVCPVARLHTHTHTHKHTHTHTRARTHRVTAVVTLSGFQYFPLQPIIKGRPNKQEGHDFTTVVVYMIDTRIRQLVTGDTV